MQTSELSHLIYPLVTVSGTGPYEIIEIVGTAFPLGRGFFVTAAHVLKTLNARTEGDLSPALSYTDMENENSRVHPIIGSEAFPCDVAIIQTKNKRSEFVNHNAPAPFPWLSKLLLAGRDIITAGYPYGLAKHAGESAVVMRVLKGHVVSYRHAHPPMSGEGLFRAYELSCMLPRGISGGPIMTSGSDPVLCGVAVGNSTSSMTVDSWSETAQTEGGDVVRSAVVQESFHLGVAVRSDEILALVSKLIGGTVQDYLVAEGLLR